MSVTDQDILTEIQLTVIETPDGGLSWSSALWSVDEVIEYMNQRMRVFLKETGMAITRMSLPAIPNVQRIALPSNWIATRRVNWVGLDGSITNLPRSSGWEMDATNLGWSYVLARRPSVYMDEETQSLTLQVAPASSDNGTVELFYISLGPTLSNTGVALGIPDDYAPTIKWGVLADMFDKLGRTHDPIRYQYADMRFRMGIEAAKIRLNRGMI